MFEYVPNVHFALASAEMIRQLFFHFSHSGISVVILAMEQESLRNVAKQEEMFHVI